MCAAPTASAGARLIVAAWQVVRHSFGGNDVPGTLMGVTVLGSPDQLVEIETVAAVVEPPGRAHDR